MNEYKSRMMTGAFTLNAQIQNCIWSVYFATPFRKIKHEIPKCKKDFIFLNGIEKYTVQYTFVFVHQT